MQQKHKPSSAFKSERRPTGLCRSAVFVRSEATKSTKRDYTYRWGNVSRADGSHTAPSYITIAMFIKPCWSPSGRSSMPPTVPRTVISADQSLS